MRRISAYITAFIITDFFIRGYLWQIVAFLYKEPLYDSIHANRCYWVCDSITYALAYYCLLRLTKERFKNIHFVLTVAFPFAINKVVESIITATPEWDWTEVVALSVAVVIVLRKFTKKE